MTKVAIAICTLNRPQGLRAVLRAIDGLRLRVLEEADVCVVVVDNGEVESAGETWRAGGGKSRFEITFVHQPLRGLTYARNKALQASKATGATHIAMIDDDELPSPDWLEELLAATERRGDAAAIGPVLPIFEKQPDRSLPLKAFCEDMKPSSDGYVSDGYTCNAMIKVSAIDQGQLHFNPAFNQTGGEDTIFFRDLMKCGHRIAWADRATVYSVIPENRAKAAWLYRRWYRTGDVEASLGRFERHTLGGKLENLAKGLSRLAGGTLITAWTFIRRGRSEPDAVVASLYTICRGAGLVAAVFGRRYKEYADPSYR